MDTDLKGNSHEVNRQVRHANWEVRKALSDPNRANPVPQANRVKLSAFLPAIGPYVQNGEFDVEFFKEATQGLSSLYEPLVAPKPVKLERNHTPRIYFWFNSVAAFYGFCKHTSWPLRRTQNAAEGISGCWAPNLLKNFIIIKDYPALLSRDCIKSYSALTNKLSAWATEALPNSEITHVKREHGDCTIEFSHDLSGAEFTKLRNHAYPKYGLLNLSGLEGCCFFQCRFCALPDCPGEQFCPKATSKLFVVPTVSYYRATDIPQIENELEAAKVSIGKPGSATSGCSSFVCVEYATGQTFLDHKSAFQTFCKTNCPRNRRHRNIRQTQIVNICDFCGENRYSRFCKCPRDLAAPVSLSTLLQPKMQIEQNSHVNNQNHNQASKPAVSIKQQTAIKTPPVDKSSVLSAQHGAKSAPPQQGANSAPAQHNQNPQTWPPRADLQDRSITPKGPEKEYTGFTRIKVLTHAEAVALAKKRTPQKSGPKIPPNLSNQSPSNKPAPRKDSILPNSGNEISKAPPPTPKTIEKDQVSTDPTSGSVNPSEGNKFIQKSEIQNPDQLLQFLKQPNGMRFKPSKISHDSIAAAHSELNNLPDEKWATIGNYSQCVVYDPTLTDGCVLSHSNRKFEGIPMPPAIRSVISDAVSQLIPKNHNPRIFTVATLNRYPNGKSICRPHTDREKEASEDGRTIIIPIGGAREFNLSTRAKPSESGYVAYPMRLSDGDCLLLSKEMNLDPNDHIYHSKGPGPDRVHFTIAARVYNGPSRPQKRSAESEACRDQKRARTENSDDEL